MRYLVDHDFHFHTNLSVCCHEQEMTKETVIAMADKLGYRKICVTDHTWDATVPKPQSIPSSLNAEWPIPFYQQQSIEHTRSILPLPKGRTEFCFGCETELCDPDILGMRKENFDSFSFVVIPTTHMHMDGFTIPAGLGAAARAERYVARLDTVLSMNLPFHKVGIAHLACPSIYHAEGHCANEVLALIPDERFHDLFSRCAKCGCGVELNQSDFAQGRTGGLNEVFRIYRIAREEGCRFYCASDAHDRSTFLNAKKTLEAVVEYLNLAEDEKFDF